MWVDVIYHLYDVAQQEELDSKSIKALISNALYSYFIRQICYNKSCFDELSALVLFTITCNLWFIMLVVVISG